MGSYASYLLETFVTLVVVCGLAFAVLYGARRVGIGRATGSIRLVGPLPLDNRRASYLVRSGTSGLVVGASEGGLSKLGEIAAADLPPEPEQKPLRFADVLARVTHPKGQDK